MTLLELEALFPESTAALDRDLPDGIPDGFVPMAGTLDGRPIALLYSPGCLTSANPNFDIDVIERLLSARDADHSFPSIFHGACDCLVWLHGRWSLRRSVC